MNKKLLKSTALMIPSLFGVQYSMRNRSAFADQKVNNRNYFFGAVKQIPHPEKAYKGGEDAYVFSDELLAVADGVGGWNDHGVDPGIFSRELCKHVWQEYLNAKEKASTSMEIDLKNILVEAVKKTESKGSSTYVMALIDQKQGIMKTLNLGDSGLLVVRSNSNKELEIVFRTKEQLYGYDFPFQCGTNCDLPYDSDCQKAQVKHNDIVVLASDGIWDNMFDRDVIQCLKDNINTQTHNMDKSQEVANCIAKTAETLGQKKDYDSPFAQHAREHQKNQPGGKVDDITVIVAQVKLQNII